MKGKFLTPFVETVTTDGRNFKLLTWLIYRDSKGRHFRTITDTDGGSTPPWLWPLIPPFGKKDWKAFVLHDGCYRNEIEINGFNWNEDWLVNWELRRATCTTPTWRKWTPSESESNWLLDDALKAQGYNRLKRLGVKLALCVFGWRAFDDDRKRAAIYARAQTKCL